jgi:hypothetical protein
MALPVVPASNIGMYAHLRESTSCDDTTNISLKGLVTGVRGDGTSMNFTPVAATNLGVGGGTQNCDHLNTWLDAVDGGSGYGQSTTNIGIKDTFYTNAGSGRAADSDGYLGR